MPGYLHDVCSAAHPLAAASPFFADFDLPAHGVRMIQPDLAFAHPLDGGRAVAVSRSVRDTAAGLGPDADWYRKLVGPLVDEWRPLMAAVLAPLLRAPRHPVALARFGLRALAPTSWLVRRCATQEARAVLAGASAHAGIPLDRPVTGGFGVLMAVLAHAVGWPIVSGGSQRLIDALVGALEAAGGTVRTGVEVTSLAELPRSAVTMLDVTPRQLLQLDDGRLPDAYRRSLTMFRYGPGTCKVDFALAGPVPWTAEACRRAGTLHLGGAYEEIASSEAEVAGGKHPDRPYVLVTQPSILDATRAPEGHHTLWAYCHVPAGSPVDMSGRIERQIERFAPGFSDLILARHVRTAAEAPADNPNLVGGDINGGSADLRQTLFRPNARWPAYRTPVEGLYLCSASTPPGGGVHGMCGEYAARTALRNPR